MQVDLSICITTYNLEKVIEETLASVFNQKTKYKYEVLIGDDGSSDNTINIIKKWKEKYPNIIEYYIMDRNSNIKYDHIERASLNRINLLKHSQGKYITFLDGDDFYIDNNKFEIQLNILENDTHIDGCAHNMNLYYPISKTLTPIFNTKIPARAYDFKKYWESGLYIPAEAFIFKNNFDVARRFETNFDDNFITFLGLNNKKFYYIPQIMANYRQNEDGYVSWDNNYKNLINFIDYDLEISANEKYRQASFVRHIGSFINLLKNNNIDLKHKYIDFYKKAVSLNAYNTINIMNKKFIQINNFAFFIKCVFIKILYKLGVFKA